MKLLRTFLQEDGSRRYQVMVPDFIAEREDFPHFEKDRFLSLEMNLERGDVLFDIGAETGWQSAIYAGFVGAENMCLFEHVSELWPTIKQVWEANQLPLPRATFCGFVSNRNTPAVVGIGSWPNEVKLPELTDMSTWSTIHANTAGGEITVDRFVEMSGIVPKALTVDVEGAEFRVLSGASKTLVNYRPLVWVSIHPELRLKAFGTNKTEILSLMHNCGYAWQYLGVDHEEHYFFYPPKFIGKIILVPSPWMTHATRHESFEEKMPDWKDCMGMSYASKWGAQ